MPKLIIQNETEGDEPYLMHGKKKRKCKKQKQPEEVFYKKAVLKNFAIFTRKHLFVLSF